MTYPDDLLPEEVTDPFAASTDSVPELTPIDWKASAELLTQRLLEKERELEESRAVCAALQDMNAKWLNEVNAHTATKRELQRANEMCGGLEFSDGRLQTPQQMVAAATRELNDALRIAGIREANLTTVVDTLSRSNGEKTTRIADLMLEYNALLEMVSTPLHRWLWNLLRKRSTIVQRAETRAYKRRVTTSAHALNTPE
jgi:hypothetical protein